MKCLIERFTLHSLKYEWILFYMLLGQGSDRNIREVLIQIVFNIICASPIRKSQKMVLVQDNLWDLFSIKTNNISTAVKIWLGEKIKGLQSLCGLVSIISWLSLRCILGIIRQRAPSGGSDNLSLFHLSGAVPSKFSGCLLVLICLVATAHIIARIHQVIRQSFPWMKAIIMLSQHIMNINNQHHNALPKQMQSSQILTAISDLPKVDLCKKRKLYTNMF